MKLKQKFIISLFFALPMVLCAQAEMIFNDTQLNESLETVTQKLKDISETTNVISIDNPSFPLAKTKEEHLVCSKIKTKHGIIEKAVFTFADNKLSYIEAKGNVFNTFTETRNDTARTYIDYDVYVKDKLFLNKKKDIAWIITKEAMHTNLFTWENPYLNFPSTTEIESNDSSKIPPFLKTGKTLNELKPVLEANSKFINIEELDGSDPNAQLQINCFGVDYLGFPRKVEARFGDNKLNVVWILTGKGEEDRIRKALTNQYGDPIFVNDAWEIFNNWQVGLRKDKPEVLLIKKELGLEYKTTYFKQ
ncbi:hypothetical protein [Aquimarina algiphila]|uniref:DUF2092 domain-containing protein n=1 Tax=Aquimarina algiphila TaxID=2047982 RepID=A0A554VDK6_9FLAO|nr:hypothetical protein [Aquimarina algiphila]TSE04970.1 hypothetical protein FOF46_24400 [Aquimarina algiphila]